MINYLIAIGIALISSVVLFFVFKPYKRIWYAFMIFIWIIIIIFFCTNSKNIKTKDVETGIKESIKSVETDSNEVEMEVTATEANVETDKSEVQEVEKEKVGEVYLTFDDGPSLSITPKILDILKEENVKATFFILNYNEEEEYLVKRIVNEGHTIAIHGYSHVYEDIYSSDEACMSNITKLHDKILASTGVDTKILRFPGGSSNSISDFNPGIMTRMTEKVLNEGYHYFDWNVDSRDASNAENSDDVYRNVTWTMQEGRSNVVLMHDRSGNYKTVYALKGIIDFCKGCGYDIKRITIDTPMVTH